MQKNCITIHILIRCVKGTPSHYEVFLGYVVCMVLCGEVPQFVLRPLREMLIFGLYGSHLQDILNDVFKNKNMKKLCCPLETLEGYTENKWMAFQKLAFGLRVILKYTSALKE